MKTWARCTNLPTTPIIAWICPSLTSYLSNFGQFPMTPPPSFTLLFKLFCSPRALVFPDSPGPVGESSWVGSQPGQKKGSLAPSPHLGDLMWLPLFLVMLHVLQWIGRVEERAGPKCFYHHCSEENHSAHWLLKLLLRNDKLHFGSDVIVQNKLYGYTQQ